MSLITKLQKAQKIFVLAGLVCCILVGLFPPRMYYNRDHDKVLWRINEGIKIPPRGCILSQNLYAQQMYNPETKTGAGVAILNIDLSKLIIEWAIIAMGTASVVLFLDICRQKPRNIKDE